VLRPAIPDSCGYGRTHSWADPDGQPATGIIVFAHQTDAGGLYARPGSSTPWRLKGWAVTDAAGHFQLATIRPGPDPNRPTPAHIHLTVVTACCGRQLTDRMFDDDPLATPAFRAHLAEVREHGLHASLHSVDGCTSRTWLACTESACHAGSAVSADD
jgi:protocatechuate 3,4-dioxygenase beta subunit